ncbi:MAG: homoserine kinase [Nitrososphaera sp.]
MRFRTCTARAPCSTANLGPGYDVFGLALDALEDRVTITATESHRGLKISIAGLAGEISTDPEQNSAGLVVARMASDAGLERTGFDLEINKGVPAGYGMGSSGASSAAAAVAFDHLLQLGVERNKLVEYAAAGEIASAGAAHYDNVSASLLGGFVISRLSGPSTPEFVRFEPPHGLRLVVAVPRVAVPKRKTEVARSVLPKEVSLEKLVHNVSSASTIVAGFSKGDVEMIARGVDDVIVEPARKGLISGYDDVRRMALDAGALAVTISGAGPSLISILKGRDKEAQVAQAMEQGFKRSGIESKTFACGPSKGSEILSAR